jgi:hypothetical protein
MQQSITILGVGGHGWESLIEFLSYNPVQNHFRLYTQTTDWGGFTGLLGRLMEYNNGELNKKLHSKKIAVLPWGDINKRIAYYLARGFGEEMSKTIDFRSFHIWEIKEEFEILSDFLALEHSIISDFHKYLELFFEYFHTHVQHLPYSTAPCLGSLWNQYLFWQVGSIKNWNSYYHQQRIFPSNLEFLFTAEAREHLTGKSATSEYIVGEDLIDTFPTPIDPSSLKIQSIDNHGLKVELQLLQDLGQSDMIIIPNGSIANWLPLVNIPKIQNILREKSRHKKLIWLLNLFHTNNEFKIYNYIEYFHSLEIFPTIIGPKNLEKKPSAEILANYHAENKFLNLESSKDIKKVLELDKNILLDLEFNLNHTFKYSPLSVKQSILKIFHDR